MNTTHEFVYKVFQPSGHGYREKVIGYYLDKTAAEVAAGGNPWNSVESIKLADFRREDSTRPSYKKTCIDCGKDVWGHFLVNLDDDEEKPLHTWCADKRRRVSRKYTFRGK